MFINSIEMGTRKIVGFTHDPDNGSEDLGLTGSGGKKLADRIKALNTLKTGDIIPNGVSAALSLNEIPLWLGSIKIDKDKEPELYAKYEDAIPDYSGVFLRVAGGKSAAVGVKQLGALLTHRHGIGIFPPYGELTGVFETMEANANQTYKSPGNGTGVKDKITETSLPVDASGASKLVSLDTENRPDNIAAYARMIGTWMPAPEILEKWKNSPQTKECYMFNSKGEHIHTLPSPIDWHKTTLDTLVYYDTDIVTFVKP